MIYSEWTRTNTGIFYQLNRVKELPFTSDTVTIENLDTDFLLENANKDMFSNDTTILVNSILAAYYHQWQDLTTFYKSIEPGITNEITATSTNSEKNQSSVALNDTGNMFTTNGNNSDATIKTSTKTRNNQAYQSFLLNNDFYVIIKKQVRNYLFINVY